MSRTVWRMLKRGESSGDSLGKERRLGLGQPGRGGRGGFCAVHQSSSALCLFQVLGTFQDMLTGQCSLSPRIGSG